jgi:hypothetical protein
MNQEKTPRELYFYCPSCKRFHREDGSHKGINRKLCFICNELQLSKTKIYHNSAGSLQACEKCAKEYDL